MVILGVEVGGDPSQKFFGPKILFLTIFHIYHQKNEIIELQKFGWSVPPHLGEPPPQNIFRVLKLGWLDDFIRALPGWTFSFFGQISG